MVDYNLW